MRSPDDKRDKNHDHFAELIKKFLDGFRSVAQPADHDAHSDAEDDNAQDVCAAGGADAEVIAFWNGGSWRKTRE